MKEIAIFTDEEKKIAIPLLKKKEDGDHNAAIKFTIMWIAGHKRALAEYVKHPLSETVTTGVSDWDEFYPQTVENKIDEMREEIDSNEEWLRKDNNMRKSTKIFKVWVDCTTLAYFPTLEEAVEAAPKLIDEYEDEWDETEAPRIYEESVFDALGVRYHNAIAMYEIDGTLKYKF